MLTINKQVLIDNNIPNEKIEEIKALDFIDLGRVRKNYIGQKQGRLLFLGRAPKPKNTKDKRAFWWAICLNDFNIIKISSKSIANGTNSCGCIQKEIAAKNTIKRNISENKPGKGNAKNLKNQKFGLLLALEPTTKRSNDGSIIWKCQCQNEGNIKYASSHLLLNGSVQSCGCLTSKGEAKIESLLQENNIKYQKQYMFKDLLSKEKVPLKFDFAIFNNQNKLKYLIEYDGIQHFEYTGSGWNTKNHFEYTQEHDELKNNYCKNNNIPLIRIKYTQYDSLTIKDLEVKK